MTVNTKTRRFFTALLVAFVTLMLIVAPSSPLNSLVTPEAEAQTSQGWAKNEATYGQCGFRSGTGEAANYADQLCWIDMKDLNNSVTTTPKSVTKDLGRYQLTFDVAYEAQDDRGYATNTDPSKLLTYSDPVGDGVFGRNVNGTDYFVPRSGQEAIQPSVVWGIGTGLGGTNQQATLRFRNIKVKDKFTGQYVSNYRTSIVDAQDTRGWAYAENMTIDAPEQTISPYKRFTPSGYRSACDPNNDSRNVFGSGIEDYYLRGDNTKKDFVCKEYSTNTGKVGTYIVGGDRLTSLDVGFFTRSNFQGVALALNMGRMTGDVVQPDTTMEKTITGQETKFDFSMATRDGGADTKVPWQGANTYTQALRSMSSDLNGNVAADSMVFKSAATGTEKNKALARYTPTWRCTLGTKGYTIKEGSVPSGFQLNNNAAAGTSEVVYQNQYSVPMSCAVTWTPKYQFSSLTLRKTVTGTAASFDEVQSRKFNLGYRCAAPTGYSDAYPTMKLEDSRDLAAGDGYTVEGLPSGATCTLTEKFADGAPPARPGKELTLTWKGNGTSQNTDAVPVGTVTLKSGVNVADRSNDVEANNNYDYRPGTVNISKTITGEPVNELGSPRDYSFSLRCLTTNYSQQSTIQATGTGDEIAGDTSFNNVPVERDCVLKPLSGLSDSEAERISFDGRDVWVDGQQIQANSDGTYTIRLKDYPQGGTPSVSDIRIEAHYSYKTRDVRVIKQLRGPGSSLLDAGTTFPVHYRCTDPNDAAYKLEGDMNINTDTANPAKIEGVRVGADCYVYESGTPSQQNVTLDRTTVSASDSSDVVTTLNNEEAKTTPVLTVNSSTDTNQNRVFVSNHYLNKTGTVDLTKLVNNSVNGANLPADYELFFRCGIRTVETTRDNYVPVDLTGTVRLADGQTERLVAKVSDPRIAGLVNDRDGAMGVPYGNECTFSETTPSTGNGVLWSTDAKEQTFTVDSDSEAVSLTNTFEPAGEGITITQSSAGVQDFFRDVDYELTCTADDGSPLDLGRYATITLGPDNPQEIVPATVVTSESTCQLVESDSNREDGTRNGYAIDRDSIISVDGKSKPFNNEVRIDSGEFIVGDSTVVQVNHTYDYQDVTVAVTKQVDFVNEAYFSQARKDVKYNRQFDFTMKCTPPGGGSVITVSGKVSSSQSDDAASQSLSFGSIPDGSECVAAEGETTAAEGITFTQEVKVGGASGDRSLNFDVRGNQDVKLVNTYTRQLAEVNLDKVANTPVDVQAAYGSNWKDQFYTHNFTLVCRDPEGPIDGSGNLGTFPVNSTIQGPGSTSFANIPVGAECELTGDKFGQLNLTQTAPDGTELETHMRPSKVEWRLQRDEGMTYTDTDLADGETTSQKFMIKDDISEGGLGNKVELVNFYEFVKSPIKMSKKIVANAEDLQLLRKANPEFRFDYQCQGVGYSISNVGLPTSLNAGDTTTFPDGTLTFTSDEVEVPSGAWCSFAELDPSATPEALEWKQDPREVDKRVGEEGQPAVSYDFTNTYTRRTVPVSFVALQDGYLGGLSNGSYDYQVSCTAPGFDSPTLSFDVNRANSSATVADASAPSGGKVVNLPVGYDCTLDASGSSALRERVQLEATAGTRSPYMTFASWTSEGAAADNPDVKPADIPLDEVTSDLKKYTYDFSLDSALRSETGAPVLTIAGEAMHPRDSVDVTFTKQSVGAAGEGRTFEFSASCGETFTLKSGQSHTLRDIDVDQNCTIDEVIKQDSASPVVSVGETGPRLGNVKADNFTDPITQTVTSGQWSFDILPVAEVSDMSTSGSNWALTGINTFPGVNITKKIDGAPISAVSGTVADTAVLPDDATTMRFNYTVENNGALPLTDLKLTELDLAGRTVVAADGTEHVVPESGTIPAEVCAPGELAVGASQTCSFDVKITESTDDTFYYRGLVKVTALGNNVLVSDYDSYGAMRLKEGLGFLLPDTGRQTLVWALLIGLILLAIGMALYMRNRDEDDEDDVEDDAED